jgi:putative ATP-dependent endonuclease of OLD family
LDINGVSILQLDGIKGLKYPYYLLKYLNIPYTLIVDKDFFFQYANDSAADSRYTTGFYKYKKTFSPSSNVLIEEIVTKAQDRADLLQLLNSNHSRSLDFLEGYNVICLNYNLEMDLVASTIAQSIIYDYLEVPLQNQNTSYLLNDKRKALKGLALLLHVVENLPHKNLPNSYKRIVKVLKAVVN